MSYRKLATHPLHSQLRKTLLRTAAGALGAVTPLMALANPSGGQVVGGTATIGSAGANGVIIHQSSQNAIINWQQFSVGSNQYVQFVQPNSSSVVLNRVIGGNASRIFGDIRANGQVFLVNPNGVYFAPGSSIDVQGLVASTLDIGNSDFMSGNYVFSKDPGTPDGSVVNQGIIHAGNGGYVVLAGDYVLNQGQINTRMGSVYLSANNAATLTLDGHQLISYVVDSATLSRLAGVNNMGEITDAGGTVVMTADVANALTASAVNNTGFITAHSVRDHGGEIVLEAQGGGIYNSGKLDASGVGVAGGEIVVHATGGDTELTAASQINVTGDHAKGGFIDISGHDLTLKGFIGAGKGGKLLLDPSSITIDAGGVTSFCSGCEGGVIKTGFIDAELNAGVDLTIVASGSIHKGSATAITATTGTGKLSLFIGQTSFNTLGGTLHRITSSIFSNGTPKNSVFTPTTGGTIDITGIPINIAGKFVASASGGTVKTDTVTASAIQIDGTHITTKSLTATALNVIVNAFGTAEAGAYIAVTGNISAPNDDVVLTASNGSIHVTGNITAGGSEAKLVTNGSGNGNGHHIVVGGNITGQSVSISAAGRGNSGASINVGNVTATRFNVRIKAQNSDSSATNFKVTTGVLTAAKEVIVHASGGAHGAQVTVAGVNAFTSPCNSIDCNGGSVSISANKGSVDITGNVTLTPSKFNSGGVNVFGRNITVGNITAPGGSISIHAQSTTSLGSVTRAITQTANTTLKARFINVNLDASYGGAINLANLTASSSKASAGINVTAKSSNRNNSITVNGAINVKGVGGNNGFSSAMPHGGAPTGAFLDIQASGNASPGLVHTVKVTGAINVTGVAGNFNINHEIPSCGECGTIQASGRGGEGLVSLFASGSHGSVQLLGATTVKGTDAEIQIAANTIKTGALTVAGSGHTLALNVNINSSPTNGSLASNNSVGVANVTLSGFNNTAATAITTGNITANGKGSATVELEGLAITAGNVSVTATTATGVRRVSGSHPGNIEHYGLGSDMPGFFGLRMTNGTFTAGRAGVFMGASPGSSHSHGVPANSIKVGNIKVTGVGEADIALTGANIQAGSLSANAAVGTMHGTFHSSTEAGAFNQTIKLIKGGEANVELDTGYGAGRVINVSGPIVANGPIAGVNLFGSVVKLSKGITVSGHGGQATVSGSGTGGSGYTQFFKGPGPITGVTIGGNNGAAGSINVGGTVSVKGPGIIGVAITGKKVSLGGISASASATEVYTVKNTRTGTNDTFTAGSVALVVFQGSNGKVTGPATVTGNVTLAAPHGAVVLATELNVGGQIKITAANITTHTSGIIQHIDEISKNTGGNGSGSGSSPGVPSSGALAPKLTAAGMSMIATAGSIDLTGATVKSAGVVALDATKNIILSGVSINVGSFVADAGGTIHNGGALGSINAKALALHAGKDITLSSTAISVGSGSVPLDSATVKGNAALSLIVTTDTAFAATLAGDPQLQFGLANGALGPFSSAPNATFVAGGNLTLGDLTLTGNYLYLQGLTVSILGAVNTPKGTLVQVAPANPAGTTDMEGTGAKGADLNLNDSSFLALFPDGITLVLGASGQSGSVTLGNNGTFNIGSDNLIVDTSGSITSLSNVISTGIISSLEALIANAVVPPTTSEIDPNSTNNNNTAGDKRHHGDYGSNGETGGQGGTISQDTDPSSVCH